MTTSLLNARHIALLGLGVEGAATLRALRRWGYTGRVSVLDDGACPADLDPAVSWEPALTTTLDGIDLLVRSPGVKPTHPAWVRCLRRAIPYTTATNLYLARAREARLTVVGVTGSKGKSTSASLVHRALVAAERPAALVGNIGHPALDALDDTLSRGAVTVFEMSSYQCSTLAAGPDISLVTNLFPEHLDWHGALASYYDDKLRIASSQREGDGCVYNGANEVLAARAPLSRASHYAFNVDSGWRFVDDRFAHRDRALPAGGLRLRGRHNRENVCGVLTVLGLLGVKAEEAIESIRSFEGLPHRLEDLGVHGGVRWVNDSISTAPEAGVAALDAFAGEAASLIMGGFDRGYDFTPLAKALRDKGISAVAALAPSGPRLLELLEGSGIETLLADDLAEAVGWIAARTPRGKTCVFSPSSPSYGRYRDFIERGDHLRAVLASLD